MRSRRSRFRAFGLHAQLFGAIKTAHHRIVAFLQIRKAFAQLRCARRGIVFKRFDKNGNLIFALRTGEQSRPLNVIGRLLSPAAIFRRCDPLENRQ